MHIASAPCAASFQFVPHVYPGSRRGATWTGPQPVTDPLNPDGQFVATWFNGGSITADGLNKESCTDGSASEPVRPKLLICIQSGL